MLIEADQQSRMVLQNRGYLEERDWCLNTIGSSNLINKDNVCVFNAEKCYLLSEELQSIGEANRVLKRTFLALVASMIALPI